MWSDLRSPRRKAGVVTLVMASVFAMAWVRSWTTRDWVILYVDDHFVELSTSIDRMSIQTWFDAHDPPPTNPIDFGSSGRRVGAGLPVLEPLELGRVPPPIDIPYWSIVLPLTRLSGWLLLSKRCAVEQISVPAP